MPAYLNGKLIESPPLMNGVQVNALYNGLMVWPYRFPALFIRVMARVDGQSLMVEQSVMAKCHRRYLITDAGSEPIVEYDTVCRKADGWTDWPESGEVSGAEGQIVSVVDCTTAGAKARAYGTAVLPKPLSRNLLQYGPVAETDGVTVGVDGEGAVTLTGTTTKAWQTVKWDLDKSKFVPGGTYTLSQNPKVDGYRNIQTWIYVDGVTVGRTDLLSGEEAKERDTFTLPDVIGTISLNLRMINNNTDQGGVAYKLQLEAGDVATAWQRPDVTDLDQGVIAAVNLLSVGPVADGDKSVAVAADGLTATGLAAGDKAVWSNQVSLPAGTYTMGNLAPSGTVVLSGTGMGTEIVNGGASRTITIAEDVADATAEVQFWNFGQPVKPYLVSGDTAPAEYIRPISETNGGGAIDLRTNLLRYGDATENGLTCTVLDDGGVHITGTAVGSWGGVRWFLDNALFQPGATYTLSGGVYDAPAGALLGSIVVKTTSGAAAVDTSFSYESRSTRFTMPDDFSSIEFRIRSGSAPASVDVVLHPQLEIGTVVTTWEPGEVVAGGQAVSLNLFPHTDSATVNGVTFTDNGDGTFSSGGTSTNGDWWIIVAESEIITLPAGDYVHYFRDIDGLGRNPTCEFRNADTNAVIAYFSVNAQKITLAQDTRMRARFVCPPLGTWPEGRYEPVLIPASLWGGVEFDDHNLFPVDELPDRTVDGVTFVNNHDGTCMVGGTNTGSNQYNGVGTFFALEAGWYSMEATTVDGDYSDTTVGVTDNTKYACEYGRYNSRSWLPANTYNAVVRRGLSSDGGEVTIRPVLVKLADGPNPESGELLVNGGFESGDLTGWTQTAGNDSNVVGAADADWIAPHSGDWMLRSSQGGRAASFDQTVKVPTGVPLRLTLWSAHYNSERTLAVEVGPDVQHLTRILFTSGDGLNWHESMVDIPAQEADVMLLRIITDNVVRVDDVSLTQTIL